MDSLGITGLHVEVQDIELVFVPIAGICPNATSEYQSFVGEVNDALFQVSRTKSTVLMRGFNAHVGIDTDTWKGVIGRAWYGMERKMEWNGTKISVWNMEDARMEWNRKFQEWNGRQSSILPYQFHTRFCAFFTEKYIPMSGGDKKYCHRNIRLQYLRVLFVDKLRYLGCLYCENSVPIALLQVHCNLLH